MTSDADVSAAGESRKERRRREAQEALARAGGSLVRQGDLVVGRTGLWQVVVGIEVHAQIDVPNKLFSGLLLAPLLCCCAAHDGSAIVRVADASTSFGVDPNTNVALLDAAFPGTLPVRACALAVLCTVRDGVLSCSCLMPLAEPESQLRAQSCADGAGAQVGRATHVDL